jgi:HSP20 family protein
MPGARLGRLLHDFFGETAGPPTLRSVDELSFPLDISEDDQNIVVRASLPGFSQNDIDIEVQNGILTISAHKEELHEEIGERFLRRERRTGSVVRQIILPEIVDEESASANLTDGVLTLRLPKTPEAMPRKIQVEGGSMGSQSGSRTNPGAQTRPQTGTGPGASGNRPRNTPADT